MIRYVPAAFDLYEFDDRDAADPRRRFLHWDGPVGSSAEEVILGWSRGGTSALVCTSGRPYDVLEARFRAAHVALGGNALAIPNRPPSAAAVARELERLRDTGEAWSPIPPLLPDASRTEAAVCDGFAIGYSIIKGGAVFIAAVGIAPSAFGIRAVEYWDPYGVDATKEFVPSAPDWP
jgi:hypothetical protein